MAEGRRPLFSDSDIPGATAAKSFKRESIGEYLTSRRGSLSDLVFSNQKNLSRDSVPTQSKARLTRHGSLNQVTPDKGERSTSLISNNQPQRCRSERRSNSLISIQEKQLLKTRSLNSFNYASVDEAKRNIRSQYSTKRKRWLRKIQSVQAFESVIKSRQSRQKYRPLVRFRRAAKTIQLLLRAIAGSRQGRQHDQVTWSQLADEQSTARRTYDLFGISFDPSMFKAKREKQLANEAKVILTMPPPDRTEDQVRLVLLALNQTVDAFGEFPIKLQRSLASVGWYEHFEAQRVIIRQGHMADNFYFILSGTAIVSLLETNKDTGDQVVRTVAFLRKGNSFGELALMHGARRSATVTCKTSVELLAVSREDFIDIFMHIEKDREPEHIQYLRSIDLLRGWPVGKLPYDNPRVCLFTYFRRGVLLCKDSNQTEWVYVIKKGTCRVLKDLLETRPNIPGLETIPYSPCQEYVKLPPIPQVKSIDDPLSPGRSCVSQNKYKGYYSRLPDIKLKTPDAMLSNKDHQRTLNKLYEKQLKISRQTRVSMASLHFEQPTDKQETHKVFVQVQKLGPRDVFGLEQTVFGMMRTTTGCSLVSDGAECILINKKFFAQHLPDDVAKKIRNTIRPIPTEESLQQKLQDQANWDAFKSITVTEHIVFQRQLHEHEADYMYF